MCELMHIKARTIVVADLHSALINMAQVAAHPVLGPQFYRRVRRLPLSEEILAAAQDACQQYDMSAPAVDESSLFETFDAALAAPVIAPCIDWAVNYWAANWMARGGNSGTARELKGVLSFRWDAAGGDSATRYRSAGAGLPGWRRLMARCAFLIMDANQFLGNVKDVPESGVYLDPPFPGPGDKYKHRFSIDQHRELARKLAGFTQARIVCRFYDHPLIRELYPESQWTWRHMEGGKKQSNEAGPEVLLLNGASRAQVAA
jgi:hypothetical protein